jgi:hypothetical protein
MNYLTQSGAVNSEANGGKRKDSSATGSDSVQTPVKNHSQQIMAPLHLKN